MINVRSIGINNIIRERAIFSRPENIIIGNNNMIDDYVLISGGKGSELTTIGNHVHIAMFSTVMGCCGATFEDLSNLGPGTRVFTDTDDFVNGGLINPTIYEDLRNLVKGRVIFKRFTATGANCVVISNITIGEGATVGAGSVVIEDIEPWTVNVGVPSRPIKMRNKEEVLRRYKILLEREARND